MDEIATLALVMIPLCERRRQCVGLWIECVENERTGDSDTGENTKPRDPSKRIDKLTAKDICAKYSPTIQRRFTTVPKIGCDPSYN